MGKVPARVRRTAAGKGPRIGLVTAEFNEEITKAMREDALAEARRQGATVVVDVWVPGVFDIPLTLSRVLRQRDVDVAVVLGAVVTGDTLHDEVVAFECARLVGHLALEHGKPVGLGVTGPGQSLAQAQARVDRAAWAVRSVCSQFKTLATLQKRDAGTA